jgi:hypothetical protein
MLMASLGLADQLLRWLSRILLSVAIIALMLEKNVIGATRRIVMDVVTCAK